MTVAPIRWPSAFAPERCPVHVVNELHVARPAGAVWARLIRAADWPRWYPNARDVRFEAGFGPDLSPGVRFTWRTFGVSLESLVEEFVPEQRIAWTARRVGLRCYHAWLITPQAGGGCVVRTEETQRGAVAVVGRLLFPGRMERWHQRWLSGLAAPEPGLPAD